MLRGGNMPAKDFRDFLKQAARAMGDAGCRDFDVITADTPTLENSIPRGTRITGKANFGNAGLTRRRLIRKKLACFLEDIRNSNGGDFHPICAKIAFIKTEEGKDRTFGAALSFITSSSPEIEIVKSCRRFTEYIYPSHVIAYLREQSET